MAELSQKACFKLMGFTYEDCDMLEKNGFSTSNLYIMGWRQCCSSSYTRNRKKLIIGGGKLMNTKIYYVVEDTEGKILSINTNLDKAWESVAKNRRFYNS